LSGAAAAVSDTPGAQASFTFTGTSVSWIGGRSFQTGVARVSLDGSFITEIDTFSKTRRSRSDIHADGPRQHESYLDIERPAGRTRLRRSPSSSWTRSMCPGDDLARADTDPAVKFTLSWITRHGRLWSGGSASASITAVIRPRSPLPVRASG